MKTLLCLCTVFFISISALFARDAYVVPIAGEINAPQLFILRRALKQAIEEDVNTVILNIDTPGGSIDVMLEMMEALDKFPGQTIAFVNDEAISAGSFIAITANEIYFSENGIMGSAAGVLATGQDIGETMQLKMNSYIAAKVRSLTQEHPYRSDVQRAMMDKDFLLQIDGVTIKEAGELLTLTALEAVKAYGENQTPLLAKAIVKTPEDILNIEYPGEEHFIQVFQISWSEEFAKWLKGLAPLLMGVGLFLLFIEFNTPGFGIAGSLGIGSMLLVFAANYLAGLAGYEEVIVFLIGLILIACELLVAPGSFVGALGLFLVLGSLLYAMADIWPVDGFEWTHWSVFEQPIADLGFALVIAVFASIIFIKVAPRSWLLDKILLKKAAGIVPRDVEKGKEQEVLGKTGFATSFLSPTGTVQIEGKRYEARAQLGGIEKGQKIVVVGVRNFAIIVKAV